MTEGSDRAASAWQTLRGYENPERYLDTAGPLARPPGAVAESEQAYVAHSCDLTLSGGLATAVAGPLAACALAEHYALRRIGGAGVAALTATAVAAAEHARTSGGSTVAQDDDGVVPPGYPRLAHVTGWLAGDRDDPGTQPGQPGQSGPDADRWNAVRLLQPAPGLSPLHRLLVALARPRLGAGRRGAAVALAAAALPEGTAAFVAGMVWAGVVLAWIGLTVALVRSPTVAGWVVAVLTPALLVTVVLAGLSATAVAALVTLRRLVVHDAADAGFGLVPGVPPGTPEGEPARPTLLDRLAGVPDPAGLPPLTCWFTDLVDDVAGVPSGTDDRHALTFGDLWLGRAATEGDLDQLRRAAVDPEQRVVDLRLVATDVTRGRSVILPAARSRTPWLLCPDCWHEVLPGRVVDQVLAASPQPEPQACPRHGTHLRALPPPWALPVAVAARLAGGVPGLLRAVPLYRAAVPDAGKTRDAYGARTAQSADEPAVPAVTTHWFTGSPPADAPVSLFDAVLPRWPTVALTVVRGSEADDDGAGPWVETPDADSGPPPSLAQAPADGVAFARAVLAAASGWRDRAAAESPGTRNRIAIVRRGAGATGTAGFLADDEVLRLALRGCEAGRELRWRFTGQDGEIHGQTGTDRYRWIRVRTALGERRRESLTVAARLPLLTDLPGAYRVPAAVTGWFTPAIAPGRVDPAWVDATAALTPLRALTAEGVLDWDTDYGAPPPDPDAGC
ncbi:MAG TPA: hypothetical protein VEV65_09540 [Kineosporiaceae bacterium]|nr:hypothetical protein [Kineosporiaceae bacterium]